ncbi:hypothetical protein ACWDR5_14735 [Streptomyces koyangensis]
MDALITRTEGPRPTLVLGTLILLWLAVFTVRERRRRRAGSSAGSRTEHLTEKGA